MVLNQEQNTQNGQLDNALKSNIPYSVVPEMDTNGHGTAVSGIACRKWDVKRRKAKRCGT